LSDGNTGGGAKVGIQYCLITHFRWSLVKLPAMIIGKKIINKEFKTIKYIKY
jgi:hypothetical protein